MSQLKRQKHKMTNQVIKTLIENKVMEKYLLRPPYQQNDYIGWINRAVKDATKQKRLNQMIEELKGGKKYMKMDWKSKES